MQIIFFADGADLAVAEKSGEADLSKLFLNEFGVVVWHAKKIFPTAIAAAEAASVNRFAVGVFFGADEQLVHVLARSRGIAPLELHGLAGARQRTHRQDAGGRITADKRTHQKIATMKISGRKLIRGLLWVPVAGCD